MVAQRQRIQYSFVERTVPLVLLELTFGRRFKGRSRGKANEQQNRQKFFWPHRR
jgi:hypothetical protein